MIFFTLREQCAGPQGIIFIIDSYNDNLNGVNDIFTAELYNAQGSLIETDVVYGGVGGNGLEQINHAFYVTSGAEYTVKLISQHDGSQASQNITVRQCCDITGSNLTVTPQAATDCNTFDGQIAVAYSGNLPNVQTRIISDTETSAWQVVPHTFTALRPTSYTVETRNADDPGSCNLSQVIGVDPAGCCYVLPPNDITPGDAANGQATGWLRFAHGQAGFQYGITAAGQTVNDVPSWTTNKFFRNLAAGSYLLWARSIADNSCSASFPFIINDDLCGDYTTTITQVQKVDESGAGKNDGSIVLAGSTNYPQLDSLSNTFFPVSYSLSGQMSKGPQSSGSFSNLQPGNYTATVTNAAGCTATLQFAIIFAAVQKLQIDSFLPLGIKINGEFLDLKPDATLELLLNSTYFADESIPGSYSIPFDVPRSEKNERILDKPMAQLIGTRKYTAEIFVKNVNWISGKIILRKINRYSYSMNFQSALINLGESFRDFKIRDLVDEEIVIDNSSIPKILSFQPPVGYNADPGVTLTVNGQSFQNTNMAQLAADINGIDGITCTFYHSGWPGPEGTVGGLYFIIENSDDPNNPLAPLHITDHGGWHILENNWRTTYFGNIQTWLNQFIGATPPHQGFTFPMFQNLAGFEDTSFGLNMTNYQLNSQFQYSQNLGAAKQVINYGGIAPCVFLKYIFDQMATRFNLTFKGTFIDNPDLRKLLFIPNYNASTLMPYIGSRLAVMWNRSFNLRNFVPDWTIGDFLKELQKLFCLHINYDDRNGTITINLREEVQQLGNSKEMTLNSAPIYDVEVPSGEGYTLGSKKTDDEHVPGDSSYNPFEKYVTGDGNQPIEAQIAGVAEQDINTGIAQYYVPVYQQEWVEKGENFDARIAFYTGINERTVGHQYIEARQQTHRYFLSWVHARGIYAKFWRSYLRMLLLGYTGETIMELKVKDLINFNFEQKIKIDGRDYLVKSISMRVNMKGLQPSKVVLQLVP